MPQTLETRDAKAAVEKELEKLEKIPAWQLTKVRNKKEVIAEARNEDITAYFVSLMDLCHLKNSELEPQCPTYKGRVVLRVVIGQDDSGSYAEISSRMLVIPRTWIRKEVVLYLQWKTTRRMGQNRWIDDDQIQRKRTPSFPSHESIVSRNAKKQRRWKIIDTLLCWWGNDWNCFSHNYFCQAAQYLRSSLRCVWGIRYLSNKNQLFEPAKLLIMTPRPSIEIPAQEIYCKSARNEWKRLPQPDRVIKICTDAGFL